QDRCGIYRLIVIFRSVVIASECPPELNVSRDLYAGTSLVGSSQHLPSSAELKASAVYDIRVQNGSDASSKSLIASEAAPTAARIDQTVHIECIANLTIVGVPIFQQQRVLCVDLVVQPG